MGKTLLAVADLGSVAAYELTTTTSGTPRLEELDVFHPPEMRLRYANTLTHRAGRSASGNLSKQSGGDNSDGESHNMEIEKRRRALKAIAAHLNSFLRDGTYERCFLAAPSEINSQLLELLDPPARARIERNLGCDLTRLGKAEILERFMAAERV